MNTNNKTDVTIRKILSRSKKMKETNYGYMMYCPAHDDDNPSLSMSIVRSGRVLLDCYAISPGAKPDQAFLFLIGGRHGIKIANR